MWLVMVVPLCRPMRDRSADGMIKVLAWQALAANSRETDARLLPWRNMDPITSARLTA
jgi:hypothetical protein